MGVLELAPPLNPIHDGATLTAPGFTYQASASPQLRSPAISSNLMPPTPMNLSVLRPKALPPIDSAGEMRRVASHVLTDPFETPPRDMETELNLRRIPSQQQMVAAMPTRGLVHSSVRRRRAPQGRREGT